MPMKASITKVDIPRLPIPDNLSYSNLAFLCTLSTAGDTIDLDLAAVVHSLYAAMLTAIATDGVVAFLFKLSVLAIITPGPWRCL